MKAHQVFFFLLLVFLPTQLGYHLWPDWAYVLGRQVDYLSPTIFLTDILAALTVGAWIISERRRFNVSFRKFQFVFIFSFIIANIYFAASPAVATYKWLKVLEFGLLGWYIVRTRPDASRVIRYLSLGVLYSSLLAIVQFALQRSLGSVAWFLGERTFTVNTPGIARAVLSGQEFLRPYATLPHPNVLGGFLAVVLPLILWQFSKLVTRNSKIYYGVTCALGLVALVLTFSRSAWVVAAVGIAYVLARQKQKILLVVPPLLLLGVFVFRPAVADETVVVRRELNVAAIKLWQSAPLTGVGLGNFLVRLPEALPSRQIYFLQPVHNIYLLLLSEVGAVGVAIIAAVFYRLLRHRHVHVSLVFLLLLGLADHYPLTLQQGQLLFTLLLAQAFGSNIGS